MSNVRSKGLCMKHLPATLSCLAPDCDKKIKRGYYCLQHTSTKRCQYPDCTKYSRGITKYCCKHAGDEIQCAKKECCTPRRYGKFCAKHASSDDPRKVVAYKKCRERCVKDDEPIGTIKKINGKTYVREANSWHRTCNIKKCIRRGHKNSTGKYRCRFVHGGCVCHKRDCKRKMYKAGLCINHVKDELCKIEGCQSLKHAEGLCYYHGPRCKRSGCSIGCKRKGKCYKHQSERFKKQENTRMRKKYKMNPTYRLNINMRCRFRNAFIYQEQALTSFDFKKYVGLSPNKLWKYLESLFEPGMTRENYGKWHIDHIKPVISFDLSKDEEIRDCFFYTNLQPLWATDNYRKNSRLNWKKN